MKASTVIYLYIIKPVFISGVVWFFAWCAKYFFGITSVFGFGLDLEMAFCGAYIIQMLLPERSERSESSSEAETRSEKPQVSSPQISAPAAPKDLAPISVQKNKPTATMFGPLMLNPNLEKADYELRMISNLGQFSIRQDDRYIYPKNGIYKLAKRPFEVVYSGRSEEQSLLLMTTPALNFELDRLNSDVVWSNSRDSIVRRLENWYFTDPKDVQLSTHQAAPNKPVAKSKVGQNSGLVSDEPLPFELLLTAPRMYFMEGIIKCTTIGDVPIEKVPDQIIHVTHFLTFPSTDVSDRKGPGSMKLRWGGFPLQLCGDKPQSVALVGADTAASKLFDQGLSLYKAGQFSSAFSAFSDSLDAGEIRALYQIGMMLDNGIGVEKDCEAGRLMLDAGVEAGDLSAIYYVAMAYCNGSTVFPKDYDLALPLLQQAADAGHADALAQLGNLYYFGMGTEQSVAKAHSCYRRAIANGSKLAEMLLESNQ